MDFFEGLIYVIWRGIAIGVIISAPMGPVGILCVQRTLEKGRRTGLLTGVGAAISDLFYCLLTGFGLSFIEEFLKENQNVIQIIGSIVLVIFGVYLFRSNPARTLKKPGEEKSSKGKIVLSGFLFTFSNPLIIFLIIGLFARFNFLLPEITFVHYIVGFISIIAGALMWWWVVTYFVNKVRSHFNLRSMWLINKITGVIIMIFALFGIVTAITNLANAATSPPPATICLNSTRGFGSLQSDTVCSSGGPLILSCTGADTIVRFLPLETAEELSFSLRCSNLHNASGKSYRYSDSDGRSRRVGHPAWGFAFVGPGNRALLTLRTVDNSLDPLAPFGIEVTCKSRGCSESCLIDDGVDIYTGVNSLRLMVSPDLLSLSMGNRKYLPVFSTQLGFSPDSLGIWVAPGGEIEIDDIVMHVTRRKPVQNVKWKSKFSDKSVRKEYLERSRDEVEGIWEVFDRMLEESRLRPGGNYRLFIVRNESGYDLIYLSGAQTLASGWKPGMIKGKLISTSFDGVFDVVWFDPSGISIPGVIKAQMESRGVLSFTFADHSGSTFRLRKLKDNADN